jgi:hypothetical protein
MTVIKTRGLAAKIMGSNGKKGRLLSVVGDNAVNLHPVIFIA